MGLLRFFSREKPPTASVAKERLKIILAHERNGRNAPAPDFLPKLQQELLAVIAKYVNVSAEDVKVQLDRQDDLEVLEVKIEMDSLATSTVAMASTQTSASSTATATPAAAAATVATCAAAAADAAVAEAK